MWALATVPVHTDAKNAQWCIDAVKQYWESKKAMIREEEHKAAEAIYRNILGAM